MKSFDIRNIEHWNYPTFKNWLQSNNPASDENEFFDFKEKMYINGKECRKDFSSFANAEGGFIVFGVNNSKKITGIEKIDINTTISNFLNQNCLNPMMIWKNVKIFLVTRKKPRKFVYVVGIKKTIPFWLRPHISDGSIYVREKGKSEPIKTLESLKEKFFQKNEFIPEDIVYLDTTLLDLKNCNFNIDSLDVFTIRTWIGLKKFLKNPEINKNNFSNKYIKQRDYLLGLYFEISKNLEELKKIKSAQSVITGFPDIDKNDKTVNILCKNISNKLVLFKEKFEKFLKLQI